jgi:menaquinone-specific isochorismate synthase
MPVTPSYCTNLFQDRKDLYQFLLACRQTAIEKATPQIASLAVNISGVDPLVVLNALYRPDQLHFYFEKKEYGDRGVQATEKVAIAAIDTALSLKFDGGERFSKVKQWMASSLKNSILVGDTTHPFAGPHFFSGFTFFDNASQRSSRFAGVTVFLPRVQVARSREGCIAVFNLCVEANLNLETVSESLWHQFQLITSLKYELFSLGVDSHVLSHSRKMQSSQNFQTSVAAALGLIQARKLDKIVLAHAIDVLFPMPLRLIDSLHRLRQLYPDCYVFSIGNGQGQNFIGASPERLVKIQNHLLSTDALAGSAPRGKTTVEDAQFANNLLNSQKELHEHRVVTDFITQRLTKLGLKPRSFPRRLLQLSNIQHLQTPIEAEVPANIHVLDAVAELHPTPAVAGMPREFACEQIRRYEQFDRSLYAAPIGWMDYRGNGEFIVGIRSALVDGCNARLYAGAGIVAGSDPERELAEVQLKLRAMLSALV